MAFNKSLKNTVAERENHPHVFGNTGITSDLIKCKWLDSDGQVTRALVRDTDCKSVSWGQNSLYLLMKYTHL